MDTLADAANASFAIPIGWALSGFITLCGAVAGMGKLVFSMCMLRIRALENEVARLSNGCGFADCHWKTAPPPTPSSRFPRHEQVQGH